MPVATLNQVAGVLTDGTTVTGTITSRLADEWAVHGCPQDIVALEMNSPDFTPYIGVTAPGATEPLAEVIGLGEQAAIEEVTLPTGGDYLVAAAGASIRDRGVYTLTYHVVGRATVTPTVTPSGTPNVTPAATPIPSSTTPPSSGTPAPSGTPSSGSGSGGSGQPLCIVLTYSLNLRGGPSLNYDPPLGSAPAIRCSSRSSATPIPPGFASRSSAADRPVGSARAVSTSTATSTSTCFRWV